MDGTGTWTGSDTAGRPPFTGKPAAVALTAVSRVHGSGEGAVAALREVSVTLPGRAFTAVMGASGSGKSTFLHCAAGLDRPSSGTVYLGDTDLSTMNERKLTELRRERVGFVFQSFNLVPALTVEQNVALPLRLARRRVDQRWLLEVLTRVGLAQRGRYRPAQLSGGQQQRVAVARALVTRPDVVFADEPTGALDTMTAREVLALLRESVDDLGQTVVMVTHDPAAAAWADQVLFLADGRLVDTLTAPTVTTVSERMTTLGGRR